jgi:enamine deaminase RidA (YjgF/YER057c/UK114 family)
MTIERIATEPDWYEPYRISRAARNGLIFVSGQAGIDQAGRTVVPGDLEAQGRQAFRQPGRGAGRSRRRAV